MKIVLGVILGFSLTVIAASANAECVNGVCRLRPAVSVVKQPVRSIFKPVFKPVFKQSKRCVSYTTRIRQCAPASGFFRKIRNFGCCR